MADATYQPKVYRQQGGDRFVVASGGSADVESGGEIDIESGGALKMAGTQVNATAAEINAAADVSARLVAVPNAATYTVLVANSGKPHVMPNLTADCTITMPTPASGLEYEFIYGGVAADVQDWIIDTASNTNFFLGGIVHLDTDAVGAGVEVVATAPDGNSNSKMSVLVPDVGTRVRFICDGTSWYIEGTVVSTTAPTFADQ